MSATASKGLANQPGENNCFLNCAVQALWHIDVFRESLRLLSGHRCTGPACIFCALKVTFTQLSYSGQQTLLPNILRKALAESFSAEQRFQLGNMDDSAECLDTILQRLHLHLCASEETDTCSAEHCISHAKFGMRLRESPSCPSCVHGHPPNDDSVERYVQLIHYVPTDALVSQVRLQRSSKPTSFADLLRRASGDTRPCPRCGDKNARLTRHLVSSSPVLILGLVWHSQPPSVSFLADVVESISTYIRPCGLFDSGERSANEAEELQLTALICYYGRHYSAFCRDSSQWLFFDDDVVRPVGTNWRSVVHRCVRGGYQPLLLLYTNPKATPISMQSALTTTVRVSPTQFRREASVSASSSSGSAGRSRCPGLEETAAITEPSADISHSRSSSLSEETLLAGGNPHLHRRSSSPAFPPPPPEFANPETTISGNLEFRRQGSYISAVTEAPRVRPVRRSDSLDSSAISPSVSPSSSPVHRRVSCSSSSPPDTKKYIARHTVETVLQLQKQQAAYRRRTATGNVSAPNASGPNFASLPRRRIGPMCAPTNPEERQQHVQQHQPQQHQQQHHHQQQQQQHLQQQFQQQQQQYHHHKQHQQLQHHPQHQQYPQIHGPPQPRRQCQLEIASQSMNPQPNQRQTAGQVNMVSSHKNRPYQYLPLNEQHSAPQNLQQHSVIRKNQRHQQVMHKPPECVRDQVQQQLSHKFSQMRSDQEVFEEPQIVAQTAKHLSSQPPAASIAHAKSEHRESTKKIEGACPTCGIADSWTIDAGVCIRCNVKLPPRAAQPLKSALSGRTASISSVDSSASSSSVPSLSVSGKPRKKKSVHFNEASLAPVERGNEHEVTEELCQLCQQRPVRADGGPMYCSVCQVYLSRFVSQTR